MLSLEKVKQIITDCQFPPDLKQRLGLILPRLDKYTLAGLGREVSRGDSLPVAAALTELWENFARILDGLKKADPNAIRDFFKLFAETENNQDEDQKLYFLNLALDVRALAGNSRLNFSSGQYQDILEYEISLFWNLPKEEVMFFLQNQLLLLESRVNLLEHIKVIIWQNDWDYSRDFSRTFSDLLFKNNEKLGAAGPKSVGTWVKEYFDFSSTAAFRTDVMEVAEFLVKDPSVQKLADPEKRTLSEILKLYVWLLEPNMNEDEVLSYKEELKEKQAAKAEQEFLSMLSDNRGPQTPAAGSPPAIPVPRNAPALRPIREIIASSTSAAFMPPKPGPQSPNAPAVMPPLRAVNVQALLKKREEDSLQAGLSFGSGRMPPAPGQGGTAPQPSTAQKSADIDKKLEDLKKKLK